MMTKEERKKALAIPYHEQVRHCIIFAVFYTPIVFREQINPWGDIYIAGIIVLVGFAVLMKLTPKI